MTRQLGRKAMIFAVACLAALALTPGIASAQTPFACSGEAKTGSSVRVSRRVGLVPAL